MMNAEILISIGTILFFLGIAHMSPAVALWDARLFRVIHNTLRRFTRDFQYFWHLGRTPFALFGLVFLLLYDLRGGLMASIVYAVIVSFEWLIKRTLKRPRPFTLIPDAVMNQPKEPHDPSFPSGDALRVWYLALILPLSLGLPPVVILLSGSLALVVSLGRIAMGVHFPLDVIAGSGIGLIGAGIVQQFIMSNSQFPIFN
jgi:undecaprenyl-diphosphatase